jgi:hypothetical protein
LLEYPTTPVVYGNYYLSNRQASLSRHLLAPDYDYSRLLAEILLQPGPRAYFIRKAFERIGGLDLNLIQTQDFDF